MLSLAYETCGDVLSSILSALGPSVTELPIVVTDPAEEKSHLGGRIIKSCNDVAIHCEERTELSLKECFRSRFPVSAIQLFGSLLRVLRLMGVGACLTRK